MVAPKDALLAAKFQLMGSFILVTQQKMEKTANVTAFVWTRNICKLFGRKTINFLIYTNSKIVVTSRS